MLDTDHIPQNNALWLKAKRAPFTVGTAPMTVPRDDEIVVRVRAVAVNPFDRTIQTIGDIVTPWITYPCVVGSDLAGEVVPVGRLVSRFQVGDRVLGYSAMRRGRRLRAISTTSNGLVRAKLSTRGSGASAVRCGASTRGCRNPAGADPGRA